MRFPILGQAWRFLWLIAFGLSASPMCFASDDEFFEKQVRPLLVKRCYKCHAGAKAGGGLSLETAAGWKKGGESGPALVPGKPEESLLMRAIEYRDLEMPPRDQGGPLSAEEIAILKKWIVLGAPDPRQERRALGGMTRDEAAQWWSFQRLPKPAESLTAPQIDALIDAKIAEHSLSPSTPTDRRTLLRRATYDLTGLPPSAAEVDAFLKDESAEAWNRVIERMLSSPQYGVQWGRHWLDVVRYADTAGENTDRPLPHAWKYRNWVFRALQEDLPFDEFARLQLCGDLLAEDRAGPQATDAIVATGYLALARRFGHDIDKDIHLTHEDVIDNLGKNFLGLTLGCARCHDHKYDAVSSEDYYALSGIFQSTRFAFPGCEPKGQPRDLVPLIDKATAATMQAEYQQRMAAYETRLATAGKESQRLKPLATERRRVLAESAVGEGAAVSLVDSSVGRLERIAMHRGEVLQLTVLPNANHGADTTRVELQIARVDGTPQEIWSTADLLDTFHKGGPAISQQGAVWCLLDVADGPRFLTEKKDRLNGKAGLQAWSLGDTPSALVNAAMEPVDVWTRLPARSFFIHPGHQRNVAVAWVCPADGEYQVRGLVADAHPAALDGVAFRLEHIASPEYGAGLITLGQTADPAQFTRPEPPVYPVAYAVVDAEPKAARMHLRGDPEKLGDEVPRRWLAVFGGEAVGTTQGSGRRELAGHIVAHPLLARVMVNRVWQWHFGRGLVSTPNDFGVRGQPPSHPELLDRLAAEFVANGYRLKPLHRLIMHTAAYQRSSLVKSKQSELDAENRWLTHFSPRRLTAEELRDSVLAASGQLDLRFAEAHPFPPESEWKYTQHTPFSAVYDSSHRSAFLMVQRQRRHPYLALFDGADPNASTPQRQATTVPTQALYFLNDPFFHAQAATMVTSLPQTDAEPARLSALFQRLLQREPTVDERVVLEALVANHPGTIDERWAAVTRVLLSTNEFLFLD